MPVWHLDGERKGEDTMADSSLTLYEPIDKEAVKAQIFDIRGIKVMLDRDIAICFGVDTGALNRAMKRNIKRFPENFCFQLTDEEVSRCQSGIPMQTAGKKAVAHTILMFTQNRA